ncbi:MAG TPA: hypothetical protein VGG65_09160, partial [Thermoanaerobaculia bacterium]
LRTAGLSGWPTDTRTYGYPLFQALVTGFRDLPAEEFRLAVFLAQLAIHLGASGVVARRLARIFDSPRLGMSAYALAALNPILLLHTTEPLSDLLSAELVLLAVAFAWRLPASAAPRAPARDTFLSFLWAAAAVVVRPANVVVVAALGAAWALRALRFRDVRFRDAAAAAAGLVPPFLPQVFINHHLFGTFNPLIEKNLYRLQAGWGMAALKYATLVMPDRSPFLVYTNPLYRGDPSPGTFLRNHPLGYLGTLLLHGFGMLDHDLPFTYVTDLAPWYRWPLALANFLLLFLAFAGLALGAARILRRRGIDEAGFVVASTAAVAAAYAALYLPVEVESRFGLALEALAMPLIVAGIAAVSGPGRLRARARRLVVAAAPLALGGAVLLSTWIEHQRTNPFVESPANAFVLGPRRPPPPP